MKALYLIGGLLCIGSLPFWEGAIICAYVLTAFGLAIIVWIGITGKSRRRKQRIERMNYFKRFKRF